MSRCQRQRSSRSRRAPSRHCSQRLLGDTAVQQVPAKADIRVSMSAQSVSDSTSSVSGVRWYSYPAFLCVLQHVYGLRDEASPNHSWCGHAKQDLVHCKLHGWPDDGDFQSCPGLPEQLSELGNSSIALRMFWPVAVAGVVDPRDSEVRPMRVLKSATCCRFPQHVKHLGVPAMVLPR